MAAETDRYGSSAGSLRWGVPDAAVAWVVGFVAAFVGVIPVAAIAATRSHAGSGFPDDLEVPALLAALFAQNFAIVGWLTHLSRAKGLGAVGADFGLGVRLRDLGWLAAGVALAAVGGWLLWPITELADLKDSAQEVVQRFEEAGGIEVPLFALGVVVAAPVGEELLFRGLLLRALTRRLSAGVAVFVAALAFALVHVVGDPGTYYYVPAFLALGLVSGWRAVRSGGLSQSIFLHAGFNLVAVVLIVA
jgi:membrane protease YdiL (CAAX protease family)